MSKKRALAWIIMFICFLIAPTIIYFAVRDKLPDMDYENKAKMGFPVLTQETYEYYPGSLTAFYEENMPFRNQMVALNNYGLYRVFDDSASSRVLLGKNNFMFYNDPNDGTNVLDYKGFAYFSPDHLAQVTNNLLETERILNEKGCEFWILIVPDKDHVYSENMPDYIIGPNYSRASGLLQFLSENTDLNVIYPLPELLVQKEEYEDQMLYYHYDTHWNDLGAYVGVKQLLDAMGMPSSSLWELTLTENNKSEYDLADLLCIRAFLHDDEGYDIEDPEWKEATLLEEAEFGTVRYVSDNPEADPRKVLFIRDSFGDQALPYFARHFKETVSERRDHSFIFATQDEVFEREQPDIFVMEISERYLGYLLSWRYFL